MSFGLLLAIVAMLCGIVSCNSGSTGKSRVFRGTLREYAERAKQRRSHEALVPYAPDEEEGTMLVVPSIAEAMQTYEWVVGEPVDERTFTISRATNLTEPDSIYTVYRVRVSRRFGRSKYPRKAGLLEERALKEMPVANGQVLVLKSGGAVSFDGVLLKKRGSPCFSELLPRPYLLALEMDTSNRTGWLAMGCRAIYALNGDRLEPRDKEERAVTAGMKERYGNSLAAFGQGFESAQLGVK